MRGRKSVLLCVNLEESSTSSKLELEAPVGSLQQYLIEQNWIFVVLNSFTVVCECLYVVVFPILSTR